MFGEELRHKRVIARCPWCGTEIDGRLSVVDETGREAKKYGLFCEDCGRRIHEGSLEGGDWIDDCAGTCDDGCGRDLCGKCGNREQYASLRVGCFFKTVFLAECFRLAGHNRYGNISGDTGSFQG